MSQIEYKHQLTRTPDEIQSAVRKYSSTKIKMPAFDSVGFNQTTYQYIQSMEYSRQISSLHHQNVRIEPKESNFEESFLIGLYTNVSIVKSYIPSLSAKDAIDGFIFHCQQTIDSFSKNPQADKKAFHATVRNPNTFSPDTFKTIVSTIKSNTFITPETIGNIMFFLRPIRLELEIAKRKSLFDHYRKSPDTTGLNDRELSYIIASTVKPIVDRKIELFKRLKTKKNIERTEKPEPAEIIPEKKLNHQLTNRKNLSTLIVSMARTTPKIEKMSQTLKIRLNQLTQQRQNL